MPFELIPSKSTKSSKNSTNYVALHIPKHRKHTLHLHHYNFKHVIGVSLIKSWSQVISFMKTLQNMKSTPKHNLCRQYVYKTRIQNMHILAMFHTNLCYGFCENQHKV